MTEPRMERLWYDDTLTARAVRAALMPCAALFSLASRARATCYDAGLLRSVRAPLPVISVGNLRVGGSGKTPVVLWLVDRLRALGATPVVAMRGYGGGADARPTWIDGNQDGADARASRVTALGFRVVRGDRALYERGISDEAALVASRCGASVASTPDRALAGRAAHAAGADVLVLDDGFQHRRLHRDLDIVLTQRSEVDEKLLPAGPLRESWQAVERADVVLTPDGVATPLREGTTVATFRVLPVGWVDCVTASAPVAALESWQGREVVAVAGIARPERFFEMLDGCGVRVRVRRVFRDHHRYTRDDWADICRSARAGERIVTTEKDLVKLGVLVSADRRLAALRIAMAIEPEHEVVRRIRAVAGRLDAPESGPHDR